MCNLWGQGGDDPLDTRKKPPFCRTQCSVSHLGEGSCLASGSAAVWISLEYRSKGCQRRC